jgi:ubiquitin-conjugating enzyme E2 variant
MHHLDPQDITLHSFAETCFNSSYPVPFVVGFALYMTSPTFASQTYNWMLIFGVPLGILTNQCHKWAHMVHTKPPALVVFLQKSGLIISHEKHHKHHTGDFDTDYCIINGWMNPFLEKIDFWRRAEKFISSVTGLVPR